MPTAALDLLDVDPFDLVEDEEPFAPVQKVDAAASVAELLDRALAIIAQYEKPTRRGRRPRRKARVTAHLPGQHRQQDHAGGLSSPNALKGLSVLGAAEYARLYGDEQDGAGIELGVEGEDFGLSARYFDTGDMHVVLELEDDRRQVLEEMNPESMRQLAYDIEELLAVDETEYVSDDPYDVIEERRSEVHDFFLSKDGVGDISLTPGEADGDYLELSPEQAQDFVNVLLDLADSYDEHFAGADDDVEVVAGSARPSQRKPVAAHGNHDQSTHGRKKGLGGVATPSLPKAAPKKAAPRKKAEPKPKAEKAPAKKAAPKAVRQSSLRDALKLQDGEPTPEALAAATQAYTVEHGGLRSADISVEAGPGKAVTVRGQIFSGSGSVGGFTRLISTNSDGELRVVHANTEIDREVQGQGFATALNRQAFDSYRRSGVKQVELLANVDVGGYAWAREGYDWGNEGAAGAIRERMAEALRLSDSDATDNVFRIPPSRLSEQLSLGGEMLDRLSDLPFGSDGYPTPYELSQLGRWEGAGRDDWWIGKAIMMGSEWSAVKPL